MRGNIDINVRRVNININIKESKYEKESESIKDVRRVSVKEYVSV